MKYFLIFATLFYSLATLADTWQDKLDQLSNAPGVLEAVTTRGPVSVPKFGTIYTATLTYYLEADGVATSQSAEIIIVDLGVLPSEGVTGETAYWLNRVPEILVTPVVEKYITDRTGGGFTAADVEAFCNAVWRHVDVGNQVGALDIQRFQIENVDGKTVKVSGLFNLVANGGTWEQRSYILTALSPNGSFEPGNANVEFQLVTE